MMVEESVFINEQRCGIKHSLGRQTDNSIFARLTPVDAPSSLMVQAALQKTLVVDGFYPPSSPMSSPYSAALTLLQNWNELPSAVLTLRMLDAGMFDFWGKTNSYT
jgi:hypothetical protein